MRKKTHIDSVDAVEIAHYIKELIRHDHTIRTSAPGSEAQQEAKEYFNHDAQHLEQVFGINLNIRYR